MFDLFSGFFIIQLVLLLLTALLLINNTTYAVLLIAGFFLTASSGLLLYYGQVFFAIILLFLELHAFLILLTLALTLERFDATQRFAIVASNFTSNLKIYGLLVLIIVVTLLNLQTTSSYLVNLDNYVYNIILTSAVDNTVVGVASLSTQAFFLSTHYLTAQLFEFMLLNALLLLVVILFFFIQRAMIREIITANASSIASLKTHFNTCNKLIRKQQQLTQLTQCASVRVINKHADSFLKRTRAPRTHAEKQK